MDMAHPVDMVNGQGTKGFRDLRQLLHVDMIQIKISKTIQLKLRNLLHKFMRPKYGMQQNIAGIGQMNIALAIAPTSPKDPKESCTL